MGRKIKVFLLEDDLVFANDLAKRLVELGYSVSGIEHEKAGALEKIVKTNPDVVLLDIKLGEKNDGLEVAELLTKKFSIPVIFITAYSETSLVAEAISSFPYAYLLKPVRNEELDITIKLCVSHYKLEKSLKSERSFYETILDTAGQAILLVDKDETIKYVNKKACELFEGEKEEITGKNFFNTFLPSSIKENIRELFLQNLKVELKTIETLEGEIVTLKGKKKITSWSIKSWVDEKNDVVGYICVGDDITERKKSEEELLLSLYAIENAANGIIWADREGKIKFINRWAAKYIGFSVFELTGKKIPPFLLPKKFPIPLKFFNYLKKNRSYTFETKWLDKNKVKKIYFVNASLFSFKGEDYFFFNFSDRTAEYFYREQLKTLAKVVENSPAAVIITDSMGNIEYVNQTFIELTGYTLEEVLGKTPRILKSGYQDEENYKLLWKTILEGKVWKGVFLNKKKNGELFWVKAMIFPIYDEEGRIIHFVGEQEDITQERAAQQALEKTLVELSTLNMQLEERVNEEVQKNIEREKVLLQQSKLVAMGEMLGNIAHQWRQPLNAVGIIVQNLLFNYRLNKLDEETFEKGVNKIMQLLKHMSATIDDFRNFFKPSKERERFSIVQVVDKILSFFGDVFRVHNIKVLFNYDEDSYIEGVFNQFCQALINIIQNSYDALLERKVENPAIKIEFKKEGNRKILKISDNAGGIPENIIDRIFEPYFTTKEEGTGIGLYMTKNIIESMKGNISVRNTKEGAEFTITFEEGINGDH